MAIISDAKCSKCNHIFEISKARVMDDFVIPKCPECGSKKVNRIFGVATFDISEGNLGNAANGYSNGFAEHSSKFGRFSGKKIRTIK